MHIVGSVRNVIEGKVDDKWWIDASSFAYAFELGSPLGIKTMGEMVALNGRIYCKEPTKGTLLSGDRFVTTGALIIPHGLKPAYHQEVYAFKERCAFAGIMHCQTLRGTSISKAPIYGENIFKGGYYERPPVELSDVWVAVVGAAGNLPDVTYGDDPVHSHVLLLKHKIDRIEHVTAQMAKDVLHLFPTSVFDTISLDIYPITELTPL